MPCGDGPVFLHAMAQNSISNKTPATKNTTQLYPVQKESDPREHLEIEKRQFELRSLTEQPQEQGRQLLMRYDGLLGGWVQGSPHCPTAESMREFKMAEQQLHRVVELPKQRTTSWVAQNHRNLFSPVLEARCLKSGGQ